MSNQPRYVRYTMSEIKAMRARGEDKTDPNAPASDEDEMDAEFWKKAKVVMPRGRTSVHLRLDNDIVDWFKARGKGHLTRINAVLRAYVEAHKGLA